MGIIIPFIRFLYHNLLQNINYDVMPLIELSTYINAPIERCFDLSRSIDLHKLSIKGSNEEAIAGVTKGLIGLNQTVTWRATHFMIRQTLTSEITGFLPPFYFRDEMIKGIFSKIYHEHFFESTPEGTLMKDLFLFESPLGFLGKFINILFLRKYMRKLLENRNRVLKEVAENDQWKRILN